MNSLHPSPSDRMGLVERVTEILRSLTLQNVLVMGILVCIAVPSWFAYKFLSDPAFRHEFMSTARIIDMKVPCQVLLGNVSGQGDRFLVLVTYAVRARMEHFVGIRSPGLLSDSEVEQVCALVNEEVKVIKAQERLLLPPQNAEGNQ